MKHIRSITKPPCRAAVVSIATFIELVVAIITALEPFFEAKYPSS